nr:anthranilate synthase component I [uncultured Caproiciproducens sp.]
MLKSTCPEACALSEGYGVIPICKEIYADIITPITMLRKLAQQSRQYFLLESIEGGERWGRYSFLGFDPVVHVTCKNHVVTAKDSNTKKVYTENPMDVIREILVNYKTPKLPYMPPFTGGFVGYFSYEMIGYAEPVLKLKDSEFQDVDLMLFDKGIAYDHLKQKISVIVNMKAIEGEQGYRKAEEEIERIIRIITDPSPLPAAESDAAPEFTCNVTKDEYCAMVEKTKEYIRNGDIFQAVISRRFEAQYRASLLNTYRVLRTANPSPYMFFIQTGEVQIAGTSPETLIRLINGKLTTFPVAGTRPRGATPEEDAVLERELLADEKELSEHNMLVDLARNDVGRVAAYSSVKVEAYQIIHRYSKVMHIASIVGGELRHDKDSCDAVSAMLPAGTLSGAPKIRACQIIDELEPQARGIYGGAVGYLDFSGNMDTCIAIRMAVKKDDKVFVQAGAGIVADSVPENEYEESANKAMAVIQAIQTASEVNQ